MNHLTSPSLTESKTVQPAARTVAVAYEPAVSPVTGQVVALRACPQAALATHSQWSAFVREACATVALASQAGGTALRLLLPLPPAAWAAPAPQRPGTQATQPENTQGLDAAGKLLHEALKQHGLAASLLILEIQESVLPRHTGVLGDSLGDLHAQGMELCVTSLNAAPALAAQMQSLPIGRVCLTAPCLPVEPPHPTDAAGAPEAADALIALAQRLSLRVTAEGVDSEAQARRLAELGCDLMLGPFIGPAMSAQDCQTLLARRTTWPEALICHPRHRSTLLLVNSRTDEREALQHLFIPGAYRLLAAANADEGLDLLARHKVDVVVADQDLPGMNGVEFLRQVQRMRPETVRMVLSDLKDLPLTLEAINEGAICKVLNKPRHGTRLRQHVAEALRRGALQAETRRLRAELDNAAAQMRRTRSQLERMGRQQHEQVLAAYATSDKLHAVLQALPVGVIGIDGENCVAFANTAAIRLAPDWTRLSRPPVDALAALLQQLRDRPFANKILSLGMPVDAVPLIHGERPLMAWLALIADRNGTFTQVLVLAPASDGRADLCPRPAVPPSVASTTR